MANRFEKYSISNTKTFFTRKRYFEIAVVLLTILLAAFVGNYIALLATRQITNELTKFIAGIFIGLLVGITVGTVAKRLWEKIQLIFHRWDQNKNII